jgi:hypothetical protein
MDEQDDQIAHLRILAGREIPSNYGRNNNSPARIDDRPTKLAQPVAEVGRIDKTIHALTFIADESKRRRILTQLNRGEDRHKLARAVFHGKRGELRQRYREGQEDQMGALGLVVNIIILWNTLYINAALEQLASEGTPSTLRTLRGSRRWSSNTSISWDDMLSRFQTLSCGANFDPFAIRPMLRRISPNAGVLRPEFTTLHRLNPVFRSIDPQHPTPTRQDDCACSGIHRPATRLRENPKCEEEPH